MKRHGRGLWGWLMLLGAVALVGAAPTAAQALSPYDGALTFPTIHGPTDPDEFSWEVELGEGQYLEQVDARHVQVFYEGGHPAFGIEAEPAHDAIGTSVPTSLAVTAPDVITFFVHHRPSDPAAIGSPFHYPVSGGAGWAGGLESVQITGPPDEAASKGKAGGSTEAEAPTRPRAHLPSTPEVERLVKREDHAVTVECRRLEARREGVGRWRCDVGLAHGDGLLLLRAWLNRERTAVAVRTHAFGDARAFSLLSW